jgi:hypothetical protein
MSLILPDTFEMPNKSHFIHATQGWSVPKVKFDAKRWHFSVQSHRQLAMPALGTCASCQTHKIVPATASTDSKSVHQCVSSSFRQRSGCVASTDQRLQLQLLDPGIVELPNVFLSLILLEDIR